MVEYTEWDPNIRKNIQRIEKKYIPLGDYYTELGENPTHSVTISDSLDSVGSLHASREYDQQLKKLVQKIGQGAGQFTIALRNNVTLDESENVGAGGAIQFTQVGAVALAAGEQPAKVVFDAASGAILGSNLRFDRKAQNPSISFSYYLRSNVANAKLNMFEPINLAASYQPDIQGLINISLPIPQVKVPGATYKLMREWAADVPQNFKGSSLISLIATPDGQPSPSGTLVEKKILTSESNLPFTTVPVFDSSGQILTYRVAESGLSEHLESEIKYKGDASYTGVKRGDATITVRTTTKKGNFSVRKVWENTPKNRRAEVTVELRATVGGQENR
ncbi:hypothetical protein [Arcanobacterium hippocoleae]|uniref:hypothetical protein n=1 Tax=Arcanobacterium hippocoleae TaxID=149017 RepID=UPI00333EF7BE